MLVKMLKCTLGSEDGAHTKMFKADVEYDMEQSLAEVFLKLGVAQKAVAAIANKAVTNEKFQNKAKG